MSVEPTRPSIAEQVIEAQTRALDALIVGGVRWCRVCRESIACDSDHDHHEQHSRCRGYECPICREEAS